MPHRDVSYREGRPSSQSRRGRNQEKEGLTEEAQAPEAQSSLVRRSRVKLSFYLCYGDPPVRLQYSSNEVMIEWAVVRSYFYD